MAYQTAPVPVIYSDFQCCSPSPAAKCKPFQMDLLYTCAAVDKISTNTAQCATADPCNS